MIKHIWTVLCTKSSINVDDNNISLDVLESVTTVLYPPKDFKAGDKMPVVHIPFDYEVVSLFSRKDANTNEKFSARVELYNPEGELLAELKQDIEMTVDMKRFRARFRVKGLPVKEAGEYLFKVHSIKEGEHKLEAEVPLEVNLMLGQREELQGLTKTSKTH